MDQPDDDALFREVVDIALEVGRQKARSVGRKYDVAFFAHMLWTAKPFIEAAAPETDEMRATRQRLGLPAYQPPFTGTDAKQAPKLIERLKRDARACLTRMRAIAKSVGIELPPVDTFRTPKAMNN
jgi:hypothetical protein